MSIKLTQTPHVETESPICYKQNYLQRHLCSCRHAQSKVSNTVRRIHTRRNGRDGLSAEIQSLESLVERLKILNSELVAEPSRAPALSSTGNIDIFSVTGEKSEDYTTADAIKIIKYLRDNYSRYLALDQAPSNLGALTHISLDPIIQRYFRAIKDELKQGDVSEGGRLDMIAALEFMVYMRNLSQRASWTLEEAGDQAQLNANIFDDIKSRKSGRIAKTLLPRVPQVHNMRGLVVVEDPRRK